MHIFRFLLGVGLAAALAIIALALMPPSPDTRAGITPAQDQRASMPVAPDAEVPDAVVPDATPVAVIDTPDAIVEDDPRRITIENVRAMRQTALDLQLTTVEAEATVANARDEAIRAVALADSADDRFSPSQRSEAKERRLRCVAEDADGCSDLAALYLNGTGVLSDKPLAISLYTLSCIAGSDAGCSGYDAARALDEGLEMFPSGDVPSVDDINAARDQQRAQIGALALALDDTLTDFMPQYHGRVQRAKNGCRADQPADCIDLGHYFWRDYASTEQWGILYSAPDLTAARALYLKACDLDEARGCYEYADAHDGMGAQTDPTVFLPYREKACDMGLAVACGRLGDAYQGGLDVDRDHLKAADYYSKGCDLGDANACTSLSSVHDIEDPALYFDYALRACVHGDGFTCTALANDVTVGQNGQTASADLARALLSYGCEDGDDDACAALARFDG